MADGNFRPKAVLFDCDGVLVDSETLTNQVLRDDLAKHGLDMPLARVMDLFVGGTMKAVHQQASNLGAELPDDWVEALYPKIYAVLESEVTAIAGIETVLDALDAAAIPYGVGSNGRIEKMEITLGRTGLLDRFQGRLYSGQHMAQAKPAPDVYLKIASDLGVAPEHCAVIEDSANGARAGHAAEMTVFGYTAETAPKVLKPYCNVLFDDMLRLPKMLGL